MESYIYTSYENNTNFFEDASNTETVFFGESTHLESISSNGTNNYSAEHAYSEPTGYMPDWQIF